MDDEMVMDDQPRTPTPDRGRRRIRDRDVLLVSAAVVVGVLLVNLVSATVRPLDRLLAVEPVVVVLLVAVTVVVLIRSVRARRRSLGVTPPDDSDPR